MIDLDEYVNQRFRITAWPEHITLPPVRSARYTLDPTRSALLIDLDDPREIEAFANQYGHLDGDTMLYTYEEANRVVRAEPDGAVLAAQQDAIRGGREGLLGVEYLEEFRFAATLLRDLAARLILSRM